MRARTTPRAQLPLPVAIEVPTEVLERAWRRARPPVSFEHALASPAIRICLHNLACAMARRTRPAR